jgi:phage terminase large subunit-like protein
MGDVVGVLSIVGIVCSSYGESLNSVRNDVRANPWFDEEPPETGFKTDF